MNSNFHPQSIDDASLSFIHIKDFKAMLTSKSIPNEKPYTTGVKVLNNRKVDTFCNDILSRYLNKDQSIEAGKATFMWNVYEQGLDYRQFYKLCENGSIREPSQKEVDFWLNVFNKDISELYQYGIQSIHSGYGIVLLHSRKIDVYTKYEKIFNSEDPHEWFVLAGKNKALFDGDVSSHNIDIRNIHEKVTTVLSTRIAPTW
jgi:hypothetical protein